MCIRDRRGLLKIREAGGEGAKKSYEIVMTAPKGLRPHEQAMADALWPHLKQGSIELKKGWKHLLGAHTAYRRAVFTELGDLGFLDKERQAAGRGLRIAGLWVTLFGVVGLVVFGLGFGHPVSYTHLRAHETVLTLVCRLLLEKT